MDRDVHCRRVITMDIKSIINNPAADALPFYRCNGGEIDLFEQAYNNQLPMLIKGPTGCGKTLLAHITRARVAMPKSSADFLARCERFRRFEPGLVLQVFEASSVT